MKIACINFINPLQIRFRDARLPRILIPLLHSLRCRCAPSTGRISWSTSVATAVQWPSTSVLAPPTFATLATTTFSASLAWQRRSSPSVLLDPAPSHSREPSVHYMSNTLQLVKSLLLVVGCAAMHRPSEEATVLLVESFAIFCTKT